MYQIISVSFDDIRELIATHPEVKRLFPRGAELEVDAPPFSQLPESQLERDLELHVWARADEQEAKTEQASK